MKKGKSNKSKPVSKGKSKPVSKGKSKPVSKGKSKPVSTKGKLKNTASKPVTVSGTLKNRTPKKLKVVYRDKKGRLVSPDKLTGKKYTKWEIQRYSPNTGKWKKLDFGKKWEPKFTRRKRPLTQTELQLYAERRFSRHKLKVKNVKGEVYAYTNSL